VPAQLLPQAAQGAPAVKGHARLRSRRTVRLAVHQLQALVIALAQQSPEIECAGPQVMFVRFLLPGRCQIVREDLAFRLARCPIEQIKILEPARELDPLGGIEQFEPARYLAQGLDAVVGRQLGDHLPHLPAFGQRMLGLTVGFTLGLVTASEPVAQRHVASENKRDALDAAK
jgi:hypothetical protein